MKQKAAKSVMTQKRTRKAKKLALFNARAQRVWRDGYSAISEGRTAKEQNAMLSSMQRQVEEEEDDEAMAVYDNIETELKNEVVQDSEIQKFLNKLKIEPKSDEETKEKFGLYENFLQTVETVRKETFKFWLEVEGDFEGNGKRNIQKMLKAIDGHDNLAIDFDARTWFVYNMTVKAVSNRDKLTAILQNIEKKLELMKGQEECPICLDPFTGHVPSLASVLTDARLGEPVQKKFEEAKINVEELFEAMKKDDVEKWNKVVTTTGLKPGHVLRLKRALADAQERSAPKPTHTLQCCHQVCQECWDHCKQANRNNVKCPLCRADDFLAYIAQEANQLPEEEVA
eukprot:CAMPEP_0184491088 /NCGR_PEP_ID=MMETSP0113_2-20130426/19585_1 /TAXON_ID=91329 /ORGANISM="Norrisiella sphaerica, Strain BC52" /LENGTH=341 /DNA_ID=CAMNT_0026875295 /DNA_START=170 /DNA_END=1195 /DNA_ORIENTATION=+